MADGNYNRSLLPHTPYESGIRMGKSIARQQAVEAFRKYIRQANPSLTKEEEDCQAALFCSLLSK